MKTGLLIGMAVLAGCASKPPPAPLPPEIAALMKAGREGPYTKGKSTEDELFAAKGQPLSRAIADDGTRTDIYPATVIHIDGSSGTLKIVNNPAPANEPEIRMHYVYAADGILRQILSETVKKGPNGEEQSAIADVTNGPSVEVTARRVVKPGS